MNIEQLSIEINKIVRQLGDKLAAKHRSLDTKINSHENRTDNPHAVTKAQVGLSNLPNAVTISRSEESTDTLLLAKAMFDHTNNSSDHDDRYYTQTQVDNKDTAVLNAAKNHTDNNVSATNQALEEHKSSTDHDDQYYTHEQVDNKDSSVLAQAKQHADSVSQQNSTEVNNSLETHKSSNDHDARYYTQTQLDDQFETLVGDINSALASRDENLETHKSSDDHDARYYTKTQIDSQLSAINDTVSQNDANQTQALTDHKSSTDHDYRYYTQAQVDDFVSGLNTTINQNDTAQTQALNTHKSSGDHDDRYYTQTQMDTTIANVRDEISQAGSTASDELTTHKSSNDHDGRYYTKTQMDSSLALKTDIASIVDNLTSTLTDVPLSANQGRVLKGLIDQINSTIMSDDATLDELQEIVDFIKLNREDLNALSISGVAGLQDALDTKVDKVTGKGLSANDFTDVLLAKLQGIEDSAEVNRPITNSRTTNSAETVLSAKGMNDHRMSGDHDGRYYTHAQVDSKDASTLQSAKDYADSVAGDAQTSSSQDLDTHKTSTDHDARYYTHAQVDDAIAAAKSEAISSANSSLTTHKSSSDHDGRYYTKTQIDSQLSDTQSAAETTAQNALNTHKSSGDHDGRYYRKGEVDTKLSQTQSAAESTADNALSTHKSSSDHDGRYYTKSQIDSQLSSIQSSIDEGVADELATHKTSNDHDSRYYTQSQVDDKVSQAEGRAASLTQTRYEQVLSEFVKTDVKIAARGDDVESMKGTEQSFQEIFNSWMRFSRNGGGLGNEAVPSELTEWNYNSTDDTIECAINSSSYIGFISPDKFEEYVFEVKMSSTSGDDDFISLVAAYAEDGNGNGYTLDVVRRLNGDAPMTVYFNFGSQGGFKLAEVLDPLQWGDGSIATGPIGGNELPGWGDGSPNGVRVKVTRNGDQLTIETTQTNDGSDNYLPGATINIDLNSRPELSVFKGPKQYGIGAQSQANSTWDFIQKPSSLEDIVDVVNGVVWQYDSVSGWTSSAITDATQYVTPDRVYRNDGRIFVSDGEGNILEVATKDPLTGSIHAGDSVTLGGPDASGARYSVSYDSDTDSLDVTHLG